MAANSLHLCRLLATVLFRFSKSQFGEHRSRLAWWIIDAAASFREPKSIKSLKLEISEFCEPKGEEGFPLNYFRFFDVRSLWTRGRGSPVEKSQLRANPLRLASARWGHASDSPQAFDKVHPSLRSVKCWAIGRKMSSHVPDMEIIFTRASESRL